QKLPRNEESFYEDVFDALLRRHDATKPGFVRPRKSTMSDLVFRAWFNKLCFFCMRSGRVSWSRHAMLRIAAEAMPPQGVSVPAEDPLADLVDITCLLLEEDAEYR